MAKIKLVEKIGIDVPIENIKVFEKTKIVESANTQYEAIAVIKDVPFTRYNHLNDNLRYYPKSLWERVIKSGICEGSKMYANHAENEADVTKLTGIWHNGRLDDKTKTGVADLYLIGKYGQLFVDALKAGSKGEGVSTVGYGEFLEDYNELQKYGNLENNAKVVRPDTYDGESYGDWVSAPSQSVYATVENIKNNNVNSSNLQESYTNNSTTDEVKLDENIISKEIKKEGYMENKSILKNMVKNEITIAKNKTNFLEAIQGLKEVDTAGDAELNGKITEAINEITTKLEESKSATEKQLNENVSKLNEMTKKYNRLAEGYKSLKEKAIKMSEATKVMKEDINCLVEDSNLRDNDIKCLTGDRKNMFADMKKLIEDRKNMRKDIKSLTSKLKEAEEVIGKQEDEMENLGYEFEEEDAELDADGNPIVKAEEPKPIDEEEMPAPEVLPEQPAEIKEEGDEQELPAPDTLAPMPAEMEEDEDEMLSLDFDDEDEDVELEEEDGFNALSEPEEEKLEEPVMESEEENEANPADQTVVEEPMEEKEIPLPNINMIPKSPAKMAEEDDEEKEDDAEEPKEDEKDEKEEMKESKLIKFQWNAKPVAKALVKQKMVETKSTLKADLQKFYESQCKKVPAIRDIEKQIMSSKNLLEAFDLVQSFTSKKKDRIIKVTESTSKDGLKKFKW